MKSVGSVRENLDTEKRISVTLETAKKFINLKFNIFLQKDYAKHLGIKDEEYEKIGVTLLSSEKEVLEKSDIILSVNCPSEGITNLIKSKSILIGQFDPFSNNKEIINKLISNNIKIFSLNLLQSIL